MLVPDFFFTITVTSGLTGKEGTVVVRPDITEDKGLELEKFYQGVRDCLAKIAGVEDGQSKEDSRAS